MKNLFIIFIIIISFLCSENYCYSATKTYSVVSIASNVKYDRYFIVSDGQKYGVASEYGKLTIPCEYPKIYRSKSGHLIVEKQENNQTTKALFNIKGEQITHFIECEDIDKICDIIIISKDGKFYKYNKDTNEEILLSEMKDSDNNPNDYIFILKNGGKYGIIECHKYVTPNNYYVILPFDYDEISDFYSRIYIISIGNKKALFNSWKKEFSTFEYLVIFFQEFTTTVFGYELHSL